MPDDSKAGNWNCFGKQRNEKNNSKNKVGKDWSFERCKNGKYSKSESKNVFLRVVSGDLVKKPVFPVSSQD